MTYYVYAIRDVVSDVFTMPIFSRSDEEMTRNVAYNLAHGDSMMRDYASDYDLYRIGIFDDADGSLVPCQHVLVAHLSSLVKGGDDDASN